MENVSDKLLKEINKDKQVMAVLLFGSLARGEKNKDIDICLVLDKKYSPLQMSRKKLKYSSLVKSDYDIQIFQQLPLFIRKRIIGEGKIIYCADDDALYEVVFSTIKEFDLYEKVYNLYLDGIKNG